MPSKTGPDDTNGPTPGPDTRSGTGAEGIRLVHSTRDRSDRTGPRLPRFPERLRTECPASLLGVAAHEVDALKSAITEALAHTEATIEGGRLPDMRRTLRRLREEAEGVAHLVCRLKAAAEPAAGQRRVLNLDEAIDRALDALPTTVAVLRTGASELPSVAGNAQWLAQMILALLAGSAGTVTLGTSARKGALVGEWIVSIRIVTGGSAAGPSEADLQMAADIAREHGGCVKVDQLDEGRAVTVELPSF